jgi:hypothetical protein
VVKGRARLSTVAAWSSRASRVISAQVSDPPMSNSASVMVRLDVLLCRECHVSQNERDCARTQRHGIYPEDQSW